MRRLHFVALVAVAVAAACNILPPGGAERVDDCKTRWNDCVAKAKTKAEGLACLAKVDADPKCADGAGGRGGAPAAPASPSATPPGAGGSK